MSKTTALYHIVFCTKKRQMVIPIENREPLYRFIWKEIQSLDCYLLRIGGIQNHVHMLIDLNPSVSLSSLMQKVKGVSSHWMRGNELFPNFCGWASEYFACTIAPEQKNAVIEYIKGQQNHHLGEPFNREIMNMYRYADIQYDARDLR